MWSIQGKTVLITGGTNGIGKATARALADMGAHVVLVGRNRARTETTVDEIRRETGNAQVDGLVADLSLVAEVHRLAAEFQARFPALHVLINNAGAIFDVRAATSEGLERTLALNHMSYFVLTTSLLNVLRASAPARIISVSSEAHTMGRLRKHDTNYEKAYFGWLAYGDSKLYNILFTYELARRLKADGAPVTANVLHPGLVRTGFASAPEKWLNLVSWGYSIVQRFGLSAERGAETPVYLASSPEVEGVSGKYWTNKRPTRSSRASHNESSQTTLWALSEQIAPHVAPA